jgi:hypothetical protein
MRTKMFGRLGRIADVNNQVRIAQSAGGIITRDADAETVEAVMPPKAIMFRALCKGDGVWLIMYNDYFYGRGNR